MSYFPARVPQSVSTLSNYAVFRSAAVVPANGVVLIGTTQANLGSFILTDAFFYCETGPATAISPVRLTASIGFTAGYADFVAATSLGGNGTNPQNALNFVAHKFVQLKPVAAAAAAPSGYAAGTPRNTATTINANISGLTGVVTTEQIRFIIGGFYTGLR